MMQLSPERDPEFVLTRPFVLASSNDSGRNLTAFMSASNEPDTYGQLEEVVIQASSAPGDSQADATTNRVDGTLQASERISTYQPVSEYQTLVGSDGSSVEFGNLLILPFENSLLYLRPVYARQESSGLNALQRIAVTSGGSVGFGRTVDEAMADLIDGDDSGPVGTSLPELDPQEPSDPATEVPVEPNGGTTEELLAQADELFDQADAALAGGDLGAYQDLVTRARNLVAEALANLGAPSVGTEGTDSGGSTTTTTIAGET